MPETYIGDLDLRLAMYRRLASLEEPEEIDSFAAELVDRFGKLPPETEQLLQLVAIKQLCRKANVAKARCRPQGHRPGLPGQPLRQSPSGWSA